MGCTRGGCHSLLLILLHLARGGCLDDFARLLEREISPGGGTGSGRCDNFAVPAELLRRRIVALVHTGHGQLVLSRLLLIPFANSQVIATFMAARPR